MVRQLKTIEEIDHLFVNDKVGYYTLCVEERKECLESLIITRDNFIKMSQDMMVSEERRLFVRDRLHKILIRIDDNQSLTKYFESKVKEYKDVK